jgi:hypothetical protein
VHRQRQADRGLTHGRTARGQRGARDVGDQERLQERHLRDAKTPGCRIASLAHGHGDGGPFRLFSDVRQYARSPVGHERAETRADRKDLEWALVRVLNRQHAGARSRDADPAKGEEGVAESPDQVPLAGGHGATGCDRGVAPNQQRRHHLAGLRHPLGNVPGAGRDRLETHGPEKLAGEPTDKGQAADGDQLWPLPVSSGRKRREHRERSQRTGGQRGEAGEGGRGRNGGVAARRDSPHRGEGRDAGERLAGERPSEGDGTEQLPVYVDRRAAHPSHHPGTSQALVGEADQHGAAVRPDSVQHPEDLHRNLAPLPPGPLGDAHALLAGPNGGRVEPSQGGRQREGQQERSHGGARRSA